MAANVRLHAEASHVVKSGTPQIMRSPVRHAESAEWTLVIGPVRSQDGPSDHHRGKKNIVTAREGIEIVACCSEGFVDKSDRKIGKRHQMRVSVLSPVTRN